MKLFQRVLIGSVPIDAICMSEAIARVDKAIAENNGCPFTIACVNAHFINLSRKNKGLHDFLLSADLNVADGMSLIFAAKLLGSNLPARITGVDLMVELCGLASRTGRSVYLLGGMDGAAEAAAAVLLQKFPKLRIVGIDRPPIGREFDPAVVAQIRAGIADSTPDFLFVCLGVPRQEKWIAEFTSDLPVKVVMGNGAAFDVLAGFFHRPPQWIQKLGMEWFYRLCIEPQRLWRRYLIGNVQFAEMVLLQGIGSMNRTPAKTLIHR